VEYYSLKEPSDHIIDVLVEIAKLKNKTKIIKSANSMKKVYDIEAVAHMMIKNFFDGHLGKAMLDEFEENQENKLELNKFV
jgi:hypothetical protein